MMGSRLKQRRALYTLSVITRTLTAGKYVESNVYTGIIATRQQVSAAEFGTDGGAVVSVSDLFTIYPSAGVLPVIEEKYIINDGTNDYEVLMVKNLEYAPGIHIYTKRLR